MSTTQITFRSIPRSLAIENQINKHCNKIFNIYHKINHCRVVVDIDHKHKHKGKLYSISIYVTIPGREIFCKKLNQDLYVAIWKGFNSLDKLLKKYCKRKLTVDENLISYFMKNKRSPSNAPNTLEMR